MVILLCIICFLFGVAIVLALSLGFFEQGERAKVMLRDCTRQKAILENKIERLLRGDEK